jgi:hypothetical protein
MTGIELTELEVSGLSGPLSLSVPVGRIRAIVSSAPYIGRAVADAITGISPSGGRVSITGPAEGRVRLVPTDGGLLPHLTVLENIISTRRSARRRHMVDAERELRAKAASYGLDGLLERYPHEIPVGRRRMTGLARALRARPDALVLEDDLGLPTWGALLATAWRGYQIRTDSAGDDGPRIPDLLIGVATVLIVPTADRAYALDAHPVVLADQVTGKQRSGC